MYFVTCGSVKGRDGTISVLAPNMEVARESLNGYFSCDRDNIRPATNALFDAGLRGLVALTEKNPRRYGVHGNVWFIKSQPAIANWGLVD